MTNTFTFRVYARRFDSHVEYEVRKLDEGWVVGNKAHSGPCDREGQPFLADNFRHDHISYPSRLGTFMHLLWDDLNEGKIDAVTAQTRLQELADWVSTTERATPNWT